MFSKDCLLHLSIGNIDGCGPAVICKRTLQHSDAGWAIRIPKGRGRRDGQFSGQEHVLVL